ncbi:MAG: CPBP family intramembrane metalloprotease [Anaerolineales bacterium]|nr:CPBP family intramembrane metalloprotease [Chloroflexota bacterium]MBL6983522.1 CPBP family intramembrane metalloprotease [Anaerolineales bacterium]
MNTEKTHQTNKPAILLEIAGVLLPFWVGLIISDLIGSKHISLGGNLIILGGPITYLGLTVSLVILWVVSRRRGVGWSYFGLTSPKSWFLTILKSLGVALAVLLTVKLIINPIMNALPNAGVQDLSRFEYLRGDLPNLIIMLVNIWITAAFLEEFLFRGYLMNRLLDLFGSQSRLAWVIALVGQAVIFGLVHAYQSPIGMFKVGMIGLVFGLSYLVVGRNLWPLILAHGLIDSLDMVGHYFGG